MTMMKAVLLDRNTLGEDVTLEALEALPLELTVYDSTSPDQVTDRIQGADIVLVNKVVLDRSVLKAAPSVRYIGVLATGMNNVDLDCCAERGIEVRNVERYGTDSVAQHAMALILSLANSIPAYSRDAENGTWGQSNMFCLLNHPVMELKGKTLLVVGYGDLGAALARLAEAFGMKVLKARVPGSQTANDRVDLDEGLKKADVVSLHCPLNEHTRNLLDRQRLSFMKPSALLINTARGGLVDEQALVSALKSGALGGAGFDVLTEEPPKRGNVLLEQSLPNLIVTPHCAWGSREARQKLLQIASDHLAGFI